jgi:hypothetical protein
MLDLEHIASQLLGESRSLTLRPRREDRRKVLIHAFESLIEGLSYVSYNDDNDIGKEIIDTNDVRDLIEILRKVKNDEQN